MDKFVLVRERYRYEVEFEDQLPHIRFSKGRGWRPKVYVRYPDGSPVDISSGWSFTLRLKKDRYAADTDPDVVVAAGYVVDGPNGIVTFRVNTDTLSVGGYWYEFEVRFPEDPVFGYPPGTEVVSLLGPKLAYVEEAV